MTLVIDMETVLYLLAAIVIAVAIRFYDTPKTEIIDETGKILWANILPVLAGAAIAVPVGCWLLGLNVLVVEGFATAVAVGIGGLALVKAALNIGQKAMA